jgi:type II secretory pathway pseudopilin PulG
MKILHTRRPGMTLVELLIFTAILALVIGLILPILFNANEQRLFQQTMATVELNGAQTLQNIELRLHQSESIVSPAMGQTGSVLMLQTASGSTNPTIIGFTGGTLVVVRGAGRQIISSSQVAVDQFWVRNTSTSASRQSVQIRLKLSRTIRLKSPFSFRRTFEGAFILLPDDVTDAQTCGCSAPVCLSGRTYQWEVCQSAACFQGSTSLQCS